jgi:formamidopyrimidine-DNA glycosylase
MPELPEVETIRRQLEPEIVGSRIEAIEVLDERWTRLAVDGDVEEVSAGRRIEAARRRGKYLLLDLEGGWTLIVHLRMTGNLTLVEPGDEPAHLRAVLHLDGDRDLAFTDSRRFGHGEVVRTDAVEERFGGRLGLEPLTEDLTAERLCELAAGRTAPLKSFLLGQEGIAGIGNIYADEALFRAELHPLSPAGSMKPEHCEALREGIVAALEAGIEHQGASMRDYRSLRGEEGRMQDEFLVHRREGEECPRCGTTVQRVVVAGRSTYFCPGCQVRLRRRPRRKRR